MFKISGFFLQKRLSKNLTMASGGEKEFVEAVKECLESKGVLEKMSAEIRSHVLKILKDENDPSDRTSGLKTGSQNFVINELIKEYLEWNELKHTRDVLVSESGHPKESLTRTELEELLHVQTGLNARKVPLIYSLVSSVIKKSD